MQRHRPRLVHDDRIGIGELRHLARHAIGEHRRAVPVRVLHHQVAQPPRALVETAHLFRPRRRLLLERRRHQLQHRLRQVVQAVGDVRDERHVERDDVAHARAVDAHVDELGIAADHRHDAVVLELVADIDHHVRILRIVERGEPRRRRVAHPQRMRLREVGVDLPRLGHRHAEELRELHRLADRLGGVHLVADDHERHACLEQHLRRAIHLGRVRPHAHARIELLVWDHLGAHALVVVVRVPGRIRRPEGRGPCRLEGAAHRFGNHVRPPREPCVLGHRLDDLLLVRDLLEAVASRASRLVCAVAVEDERRLLLVRIEHLAHRVYEPDHGRLHDDRRLARRLDIARGHRGARPLVRREDVFELRSIDQRLIEMRVLARRVAEHVLDAGGDQLLGKALRAGAFDHLEGAAARRLRLRRRHQRFDDVLRGAERDAGGGQSFEEGAARDRLRQETRGQISHCLLPLICVP